MNSHLRSPSPALVLALLALFASLGGAALAAKAAKKNTVVSKSIRNGAVKSVDIADGSVQAADLAPDALANQPIDESKLDGTRIPGVTKHRSLLAVLGPNQSKTVSFGTFTFVETANGAGNCTDFTVNPGSNLSTGSFAGSAAFVVSPNVATGMVANGFSDEFLVAANDGSEQAQGHVGLKSLGGACLIFGYVFP